MELWPYQVEAVEQLRAQIRAGHRRVILQAPTGAGKTVMASEVIRCAVGKGSRVLFLAHARELIDQCVSKLRACDLLPGIIMAGRSGDPQAHVQVVSKDTLLARAVRSDRITLPPANLVITDEAHRSMSSWYQVVLDQYPHAVHIGLTATPVRGDGVGLGDWWQGIVISITVPELIRGGYLVPARVFAPFTPDMTGVKKDGNGEWVRTATSEIMNRPKIVGDVVAHWQAHASDRLTVVFATVIDHSLALRDRFAAAGVPAEHLDAKTPLGEREAILERLRAGVTRVLCNVNVVTEGWDLPALSCLVDCQPNRRLGRCLQKWGRVLRRDEGKTDAIVLDHAGNALRHGLPGDDRHWSLDTTTPIEEREEDERKKEQRERTICCPQCFCVYSGRRDCPNCGHTPVRQGKPVETTAGTLVEIAQAKPMMTWDDKQRIWLRCLARVKAIGLKVGAAAHMYRKDVGSWPREVEPMPSGAQWQMQRS